MPADDVEHFRWTCPRTGDRITLIAAGDMEYGAFEDALEAGDAGQAQLIRAACVTPDDHAAVRRLRMREANRLFAAWNGGASAGESVTSSASSAATGEPSSTTGGSDSTLL
jgi:hypothetical protein